MLIDIPKKQLNLAVQLGHLRAIFPDSFSQIRDHCELEWRGQLKPTAFSETYVIGLNYRIGNRPRVEVLEPELVVPERRSDIHMFRDGSLCLYFRDEFEMDMTIAKTILPWTSEWLVHYELWLATGEWHGGGIHLGEQYSEKDIC
jgi:hypothetical protein